MKPLLLFFAALFIIGLHAKAQPVLTSDNTIPKVGDVLKRQGAHTSGVTLGSTGANQTWDYSNLVDSGVIAGTKYIDPATTPFAASFSGTNLAATELGSDTVFVYYKTSATVWQSLGVASATSVQATYTKPLIILRFPFTYNSFFTDTVREVFTGTNVVSAGRDSVYGEGYGTLKLPGHTYNNVLRVKTILNINTPTTVNGLTLISNLRNITITYSLPGNNNALLSITQSYSSTTFNGIPFPGSSSRMYVSYAATQGVCKPDLGKDTTIKICPGTAANITNIYNTAGLTTAWSTTRPDSVSAGTYTLIVTSALGCKDTAVVTVANNNKPNIGKDTTIKICAGSAANILNVYNTAGFIPAWSTPRPDSVVAGKYTLIVTSITTGCKDTAVVTVTNNPKPALGKDSTVKICAGSYTNIKNLYNTTGLTASWSVARPDSVGVGKYTLIVTNSTGCKDTAVVTVAANPKPALGKDSTVKICAGSYANIKNIYNTTGLTVAWSVARPDSVGVGVYTLIVTNATGCKDTAVVTVAANPKPSLGKDSTVKICAGSYTNIKNIYNTTGLTASWSVARPDSVGVGVYTLVVTNATGCKDTAVVAVAANPKPALGKDSTVKICAGTYTNIKNIYNTTGLTVAWSVARPDSVGAGKYTLIVTNATGCKDTAVVTVTAVAKPALGKDSTVKICAGTYTNIKNIYNTTGLTATWSTARPDSVVAGKYTLIVTNTTGCKDTAVVTVTAVAKPALGKDTTITTCKGTPLNLTTVYKTTGLTTAWSTPRPDSVVATGKYTLIVTNTTGCKDTAVITVANYSKPSLGKDTTITICSGSVVNLTTVFKTTGLTTTWSIARPDSVTKAGAYTLIAANSHGCKDTAVATVVVKTVKPVINPVDTVKICAGDSLLLSVTGGPYASYNWSNSAVTPTIKVTAAGTYKVTVKDSAGCSGTSAGTVVKVNSAPAVPTIKSVPSVTTDLCPGTMVILTSSASSNNTWSTGVVTRSDTVYTAGAYTVKVTNPSGCSKTSDIKNVTYKTCGAPGLTKASVVTTAGAVVSWSKVACAVRYEVQYRKNGTTPYTTVTTTDSFYTITGLTAATAYQWRVRTDCIISPLSASAYTSLSTFTTGNGLMAGNVTYAKQGNMATGELDIKVTPNPAHSNAVLQVNGMPKNYTVVICDMAGKRLWQSNRAAGETSVALPVQSFSQGVYVISVSNGQQAKTIKWIVGK